MQRCTTWRIGLLVTLLVVGMGCQFISGLLELLEPEAPQLPAPAPIQPPVAQPPAPQPQPQPQPPVAQPRQPTTINLVGIWESQIMTEYGTVYSQMILQRNGTYSYQVRLGDLLTYEVGMFQVLDGFIHFSLQDYEPKVYKGRQMDRPQSWGVYYTVVDENTMIWEDRIIGTRWTVYRQR